MGVTGRLGGAGAGLAVMEGRVPQSPAAAAVLARRRNPVPRLDEGRALAAAGVHAMIDLSDGLATDAGHIGRASGVRLRIDLRGAAAGGGRRAGLRRAWRTRLAGWRPRGEKTTSCASASHPPTARASRRPSARWARVEVTWIGRVVEGPPGVSLIGEREEDVRLEGFEHRW